jgi:hypothetical protein
MFKNLKGAKDAMSAAPDMMKQAQEMANNARAMAAANDAAAAADHQAAAERVAAAGEAGSVDPIAGVSLEQFAEVSRELQNYNYDQTKAPEIAASKGISAEDWQAAMDGWNDRIKADPAIAKQFNTFYRAG